jgi:hypothetical protein
MSDLVFALAIVGMVAMVAMAFGSRFHWKTGRNGCEISVDENAAKDEKK